MNRCTATLTTATVEPCQKPGRTGGMACLHPGCVTLDGVWHRVTLHELKCSRDVLSECDGDHVLDEGVFIVEWIDDTPGAKPHKPPLVTDAEVRAFFAYVDDHGDIGAGSPPNDVRAALEAAAKARQEQAND